MDSARLEHFRRKLQRRRHTLVRAERSMPLENSRLRDGRGAEYEEEAQDELLITTMATLDTANDDELAEIDAALARIEDGTFGHCEIDGGEIEPDRLEALPHARLCARHADEQAFERAPRPPPLL
ncbi:MAG: TraR/DksA family transcriptional regulator [Myxococcaceae bacterium]|nr:TraR/DksA family transcriptional regulator [Myxococcaceae bacterium]